MFASWGFALPLGVTIGRFGRAAGWFPYHRALQITGVVLSTGGLVVAILMVRMRMLLHAPCTGNVE